MYGCPTWILTKQLEKKQNGNYMRMLDAVLNRSLKQYCTKKHFFMSKYYKFGLVS